MSTMETPSVSLGSELRYFQVSPIRFILSAIVTFGIYDIYWCFRNWEIIRNYFQSQISPFGRAFFAIFFIYDLFKTILLSAQTKGYASKHSAGILASGWILLTLLGTVSSRVPATERWGWVLWFFSLFSFVFALPILAAIKHINAANNADVSADKKFTIGQIIMLVAGSLWWFLLLLG